MSARVRLNVGFGHAWRSFLAKHQGESRRLTGVAADGGAMVRAEALASLVSTARSYLDPPQLKPIR